MSEETKDPTIEEQRELLETIKFTPCTYKVDIIGRGGEIVVGKVPREAYDYLLDNQIDIEDFIDDEENDFEVPEEYQFITEGAWYECDNLAHENGAEMSSSSEIVVYDEHNTEVWRGFLDIDNLSNNDIEFEEIAECYIDDLPEGTAVFVGQTSEKGQFFGGEFVIKQKFDPTKFKIEYSDIEGWNIFSSIQYNGEYIDNNEYGTTSKGMVFDLQLIEKIV